MQRPLLSDGGCEYKLSISNSIMKFERRKPPRVLRVGKMLHTLWVMTSWCNKEQLSLPPSLNICSVYCLSFLWHRLEAVSFSHASVWSESMPEGQQRHLAFLDPSHSTSQGEVSSHNWLLLPANWVRYLWSRAVCSTLRIAYNSEFSGKVKINKTNNSVYLK